MKLSAHQLAGRKNMVEGETSDSFSPCKLRPIPKSYDLHLANDQRLVKTL